MTAPFTSHAPSEPQLLLIAELCEERALVKPDAVASMAEASEIIGAILKGTYDPDRYAYWRGWTEGVPF